MKVKIVPQTFMDRLGIKTVYNVVVLDEDDNDQDAYLFHSIDEANAFIRGLNGR